MMHCGIKISFVLCIEPKVSWCFQIEEQHEQQNMIEVEEDDKHTRDGSVDRTGLPAIKGKSGGWTVGILLLGNCPKNN